MFITFVVHRAYGVVVACSSPEATTGVRVPVGSSFFCPRMGGNTSKERRLAYMSVSPSPQKGRIYQKKILSHLKASHGEVPQHSASLPSIPAKGLMNSQGDNNCFLNVVIQSLWHVDAFREHILSRDALVGHKCSKASCILCALQVLFRGLQGCESEHNKRSSIIEPASLRTALSIKYAGIPRYQLGALEDASEALEQVLEALHESLCNGSDCSEKPCIVHSLFSLTIRDQYACACGNMSPSTTYDTFMYYVYASELVKLANQNPQLELDELVHLQNTQDLRPCSSVPCTKMMVNASTLMHSSSCFILTFVHDEGDATRKSSLAACISESLKLSRLFGQPAQAKEFALKAVVFSYGNHYVCYCKSNESMWHYMDDAIVREAGTSWKEFRNGITLLPSIVVYEAVTPARIMHLASPPGTPVAGTPLTTRVVPKMPQPMQIELEPVDVSLRMDYGSRTLEQEVQAGLGRWKCRLHRRSNGYLALSVTFLGYDRDGAAYQIQMVETQLSARFMSLGGDVAVTTAPIHFVVGQSWEDEYFMCPERRRQFKTGGKIAVWIYFAFERPGVLSP